jgi:hypothetical protein
MNEECFRQAFASTTGRDQAQPKIWNAYNKEPEEKALGRARVEAFQYPVKIMILLEQVLFEQMRRELKPAPCQRCYFCRQRGDTHA